MESDPTPDVTTKAEPSAIKNISFELYTKDATTPYIGLVVEKTGNELFGLPVAHLKPESFKVTVQKKDTVQKKASNVVTMNIRFDLDEVKMIKKMDDEGKKILDKAIQENRIGFLGFKEENYLPETEEYEIDTKKMPKLVLKPLNNDSSKSIKFKAPLVLKPTIESNDTTVRVNSSFIIKGQVGPGFYKFAPGLKVRIAQKILGEYIVGGLSADNFTVRVKARDETGSSITANICFDLHNAEISDSDDPNDPEIQNPEWLELLQQNLIAYFTLAPQKNDSLANSSKPATQDKVYEIAVTDISSISENETFIRADFSFNMVAGQVSNLAKAPGHAGKFN
jgi:hypothetical protein